MSRKFRQSLCPTCKYRVTDDKGLPNGCTASHSENNPFTVFDGSLTSRNCSDWERKGGAETK